MGWIRVTWSVELLAWLWAAVAAVTARLPELCLLSVGLLEIDSVGFATYVVATGSPEPHSNLSTVSEVV